MSLRTKLIFLFLLLAVAPLLILAGFSYWQAQSLFQQSARGELQRSAQAVSTEVVAAREEILASLGALARSAPPGSLSGDGGGLLPEEGSSRLDGAAFLRWQGDDGSVRFLRGQMPENPVRCGLHENASIVEFAGPVLDSGTSGTLTAGFWASDLLSQEARSRLPSLMLVDPTEGRVLYAEECDVVTAPHWMSSQLGFRTSFQRPEGVGTFEFEREGVASVGAFAHAPGTGWTVVTASSVASVVAPLHQLFTAYWIFVLGLALFTALAFSVLLGRFTKSLSELARAAEEIGTGELDPWLPLPTSGEIGQVTLAMNRMLARIRQMMTQVEQSGRLAVVGQLSAYLAHEIRNPLSSIKLNLQRLQRWTRNGSLPEFCAEPLEISLREVERLSASVSGVLQLSRAEDSAREVVSLHRVLEEAADLLRAKFRRQGVELILDLDAEADRIHARAGQVKSLVLNLMVNALEAQPHGGRLEVRSELSRGFELGGPVVALHFKDEGGGVPSEIRDRIFEPFFTTKPGGSGIGLAMASQAARENDGEIHLEPSFAAEEGAEFVLAFPLAAAAITPAAGSDPVADEWLDSRQRWSAFPRRARDAASDASPVPAHLMTPDGLAAVLPPARTDRGEAS